MNHIPVTTMTIRQNGGIGRIGKFHELTPGDGKLYSVWIQVRTKSHATDLYGYWKARPDGQPFHLLFSWESGYEWGKRSFP